MSTQRFISTSFWDDAWVRKLPPAHCHLYLYLMTSPLTNIAGVYKITVERICFDTHYDEDTVKGALRAFARARKAILSGEYVVLPAWPAHQRYEDSRQIRAGIDAILKTVPKSLLNKMVGWGYRYPIQEALLGYKYSPSYLDSDSDTDTDTDIDLEDSDTAPPQEAAPPDKPAKIDEAEESAALLPAVAPETPRAAPRKPPPALKDTIAGSLEAAFIAETGDPASWGKERANCNRLSKAVRARAEKFHAPPERFAAGFLETYRRLIDTGDEFWRKQPFTASAALSLFDRVIAEAMRAKRASAYGSVDRAEKVMAKLKAEGKIK